MSSIKYVFFDRDDTLLFMDTKKKENIIRNISEKLKLDFHFFQEKFENWNEKILDYIINNWKEINTRDKEIDFWYKSFEDLFNTLFPQKDNFLKMQEAVMLFYNKLLYYKLYNVYDDVILTLKALKDKGCKLGVISDTLPMLEESLEHFKLSGYFDSFTAASDIGYLKPSKAIFEKAIKSLNGIGENAIYIDDKPEKLHGLADLGIKGILIDRDNKYPENHDRINKLSDIINLI